MIWLFYQTCEPEKNVWRTSVRRAVLERGFRNAFLAVTESILPTLWWSHLGKYGGEKQTNFILYVLSGRWFKWLILLASLQFFSALIYVVFRCIFIYFWWYSCCLFVAVLMKNVSSALFKRSPQIFKPPLFQVFPLILALISCGQSHTEGTEQTNGSCYNLCPAGKI